ncbi:transcription factor SPT20 homolog isoform X2 [Centruroides vittatus]|uniref:transcription factor SPT20 homolog isoform X2 n=1 Tax=Centruroides vittatus TaxID=120091 RepID=UPI00350F3285
MEAARQYADFLLQTVKQRPMDLLKQIKPETKWKSLQQKLMDLYIAGCSTSFKNKNLFGGSQLLEKLVIKEKLNCLVVNLYLGNEGYSLMLKTRTGCDTETIRLPYEEGEILQYIDNEELPPLLIDLLERSQANLFYNGCVIVEVRDYRRTSNPSTCDYHHVLLRPTTQTIISDVGMLTNDGQKWTWDERQALEATLLLATSEPLCLNPSVSVAILANHLHHRKHLFSRRSFKKLARKHSQANINKKRKFEHCPAPPNLKLYDFLAKRRNKSNSQPLINLKLSKQVTDNWKQQEVNLKSPESIEVEKYAISNACLKDLKDYTAADHDLTVVEEYIMEAEKTPEKKQYTHITILFRASAQEYFGKLSIGQDAQQIGTSCCFKLGNSENVKKYIDQFTEIFTEEGRKHVKITHSVPGQPPKITHTPRPSEFMNAIVNSSTLELASEIFPASSETSKITAETTDSAISKKMSIISKLVSSNTNNFSNSVEANNNLTGSSRSTVASVASIDSTSLSQPKARSPSIVTSTQGGSEIVFSPVSSPSSTDPQNSSSSNLLSPPQNILSAVNITNLGIGIPNLVTLSNMTQSSSVTIPLVTPSQPTLLSSSSNIGMAGVRNQDASAISTTSSLCSSISSIGSSMGSADVNPVSVETENVSSEVASAVILSPDASSLSSGSMTPQRRHKFQMAVQRQFHQQAKPQQPLAPRTKSKKKTSSNSSSK